MSSTQNPDRKTPSKGIKDLQIRSATKDELWQEISGEPLVSAEDHADGKPDGEPPRRTSERAPPLTLTKSAGAQKPVRLKPRPEDFPDPPSGSGSPPATIENLAFLCALYSIKVRYNVIKKQLEILIPGHTGMTDNAANSAITRIQSIAARQGMATGAVPALLAAIGDENPYNPVAEWIHGKPWDGEDRLRAFYATITTEADYPVGLKETLMYRWLLSAVAAATVTSGFRARGVLTLQGPQGLGKTSWCRSLVPEPALREAFVKLDHHLDGGKDSQIGAITHWIVEIGELDSSFRKDVARLKGFLTNDRDKLRRPYDRVESEYQRRTVFMASVNQQDFLVDPTGNSRWWTLPCTAIDHEHSIDMQQLFAQTATLLDAEAQWWLTPSEEKELEFRNSRHRSFSVVVDRLEAVLDLDPGSRAKLVALTATDLLERAGFERPTNTQAKECAAFLREHVGASRRIQGSQKWYVRFQQRHARHTDEGPDEESDEHGPGEETAA